MPVFASHGSRQPEMANEFQKFGRQDCPMAQYVGEFHFTVEHQPGVQHGNADGLCRQFNTDPSFNVVLLSMPLSEHVLCVRWVRAGGV